MAQQVKTQRGIARASWKTERGIAIASLKTERGVDNTASGGGTSPGTTGLVAWYDFADASDADGGTYNLSEQNTPAYTAGPPSYGSATDGAPGAFWQQTDLDNNFGNVSGDWSMVIRWRANAGIANDDVVFLSNGTRWRVRYNTTAINAVVGSGSNINSTVAAVEGTWYTTVLVRDQAGGISYISVNGETFVSQSVAGSFAIGTALFGAASGSASNPIDIDFAGFWAKTLTQDNVTWLYNSAGTRTYAEL